MEQIFIIGTDLVLYLRFSFHPIVFLPSTELVNDLNLLKRFTLLKISGWIQATNRSVLNLFHFLLLFFSFFNLTLLFLLQLLFFFHSTSILVLFSAPLSCLLYSVFLTFPVRLSFLFLYILFFIIFFLCIAVLSSLFHLLFINYFFCM